ncbi:MAG: hypothetical protein WC534_03500 [Candidatus Paceibacterota bacterium]
MKTALFVPGFLKGAKDVKKAQLYAKKVEKIFSQYDWKIMMADCYHGACNESINAYSRRLADQIACVDPQAIIAHSMGTLVVRGSWKYNREFSGPIVFVEGPNAGVSWWKLLLFVKRYPIWRAAMRDTIKESSFMKDIKEDNIPNFNKLLEIQGKFSQIFLARNVFVPLEYAERLEKFPLLGHRAIIIDEDVIKTIINFINS